MYIKRYSLVDREQVLRLANPSYTVRLHTHKVGLRDQVAPSLAVGFAAQQLIGVGGLWVGPEK
jgi:hypothetical protein